MKKLLLALSLIVSHQLSAGELRGKTENNSGKAVAFATVVAISSDSTFTSAVLTDADGFFIITDTPHKDLLVTISHLSHETHQLMVPAGTTDVATIVLHESSVALDAVAVRGDRPIVKAEGSTLIYNAEMIAAGKPVNSAYELLGETPGLRDTGDGIELVGASGMYVIINGQMTSLSPDQLFSMLKAIPASRVKSIEVSYSAPAKYNVKGAVINVVLDEGNNEGDIMGEAGVTFIHSARSKGSGRANLVWNKSRWSWDILGEYSQGKFKNKDSLYALQPSSSGPFEVEQRSERIQDFKSVNFRSGIGWQSDKDDRISLAYYLNWNNIHSNGDTRTHYYKTYTGQSENSATTKVRMHNIHLQYDRSNILTVGADYTRYFSPYSEDFLEQFSIAIPSASQRNESRQTVDNMTFFANSSATTRRNWKMSYGLNFIHSRSTNTIDYFDIVHGNYIPNPTNNIDNFQKEYSGNVFYEISKSITEKFNFTASLKPEYFRSEYDNNGVKSTLWNEWTLYPNASFSYIHSGNHIIQYHLTSDKRYPSYMQLTPQRYSMSSYMIVEGNPELKPSTTYSNQLIYMLKQKYIFVGFFNYTKDYFTQLPYQDTEQEQIVYVYENFDRQLQTGLSVVIPVIIAKIWDMRLTLTGMYMSDKSRDFKGMKFENDKWLGSASMNNTFTLLNKRQKLHFTVDGYYHSGAIQGLYDLGNSYSVSTGLKWTLENGSYLNLRYSNITRRQTPNPIKIEFENQNLRMTITDYSMVTLSFSYRFGNYKQKEYKKVDSSRYGR